MARGRNTIEVALVSSGASAVSRDLNSVAGAAQRLGVQTEASATKSAAALNRVGSGAQGLSKHLSALSGVSPVFAGLNGHLETLGGRMKDVETVGTSSATTISRLGAASTAATVGLAALAASGVKQFVDLTGTIRGFQRVTGTSAEDASKLAYALGQLGVDSTRGQQAMFVFGKNIETSQAKLAKFGFTAARNADGTVNLLGSLYKLSAAFNATSSASERSALVAAAFGARAGRDLIPVLQRGKDGLAELAKAAQDAGLVFDQSQLNQGKELSLSFREAEASVRGLVIGLSEGLAPTITSVVDAIAPIVNALNRMHVLGSALAGLIAGKLAASFVGMIAKSVQIITFNNLMSTSFGRLTVSAEESALALAAAETSAATSAATMTGLAGTIGGLAGPVGIVAGLGFALAGVASHAKDATVNMRELATATADEMAAQFEGGASGGSAGGPAGLGGVRAQSQEDQFRQVAQQNQAAAKRIIAALKERGVDTTAYEKILKDEAAATRQLAEDSSASADSVDGLTDSTSSASSALTNAASATDLFSGALGRVHDQLAVASATRAFTTELEKLGQVTSPLSSGDAEHAKRVDDLASAQRAAAASTRQREAAERDLAAVQTENVALMQREADLTVKQAELDARTSTRDAAKAADHVARLRAAGRSDQEIAAAQDEADRLALTSAKAQDAVVTSRRDAAQVGPEHEQRLADATQRVADSKVAEKDAVDKVTEAYLKSLQPASELGSTTGDIADQLAKVVTAAEALAQADINALMLDASAGSLIFADTLATVAQQFPALQAALQPIIDQAVQSARIGQEQRPAVGAISSNRASGGPVTGGWYMTGELGPEAMYLSPGSSGWVYPHGQTRGMLSGRSLSPRALGGPVGGGYHSMRETVKVVTIPQKIIGNENVHVTRAEDAATLGRRMGLKGMVEAHG